MARPRGAGRRRRRRATPAARGPRRRFGAVVVGVLPLLDGLVGAVGVLSVPLAVAVGGDPGGTPVAALPDAAPKLEVGKGAVVGVVHFTDVPPVDPAIPNLAVAVPAL